MRLTNQGPGTGPADSAGLYSIHHHGAVDGVTGSCHELRVGEHGILIDCGLFQGDEASRGGAGAQRLEIDFPIDHLSALVVTHVHIDHVGRIPYLLAAGFTGPILCSEPSAELLPLVLEDAVRIGFTRDRRLVQRFLGVLRERIVPLSYGRWHAIELSTGRVRHAPLPCGSGAPTAILPAAHLPPPVAPATPALERPRAANPPSACPAPLGIRLQPAGHILGSAYVECRIGQGRSQRKVIFSGDLGAPHAPLLPAPRPPYTADVLVIESTYGDRLHEDRRQRRETLRRTLEHALADRGTVLIPAFSIGRTQELLYELEGIIYGERRRRRGGLDWDRLEIIVDSPLASRFTEAYRRLRPHWDAEARRRLRQGRHPLAFEQLTTIDSHTDHQRAVEYLARSGRPSVVIAASGMCAGGRVVNYLKALLGEARNDVLFVGYQARGTPGRVILEHGPRGGWVELDGQRYDIRARIHRIGGYSAHADQKDLVNFIRRMRHPPKQVRLIHGDDGAKRALRDKLQALDPGLEVVIP